MCFYLVCIFLLFPLASSDNITFGAFNIKTLGPTKASKDAVMDHIKSIILNYDVILIQEIRDLSQGAMETLYERLNSVSGVKFSYIKSDRLGRTSYKEQYAYYYRSDKLDIIGAHQYNDTNDDFEREPFSVVVRVPLPNGGVLNVALVGVHVRPSDAVDEIDQLDEVSDAAKEALFTEKVIILGDLNADCSYADDEDLNGTKIFSSSDFTSFIGSDADTTTYTTTNCSYDRIITSGLTSMTMEAEVDRFDTRLNLTYTETKAVSDHYPVKLTMTL